ncbi:hypothetical protein D3C75_1033310 [compost metagenome]
MKKFIKNPIIVEAYQTDKELKIDPLEGVLTASHGDWIITGITERSIRVSQKYLRRHTLLWNKLIILKQR